MNEYECLAQAVNTLYRGTILAGKTKPQSKGKSMDPLSEIAAIKAAFDAQTQKVNALTSALAAAQAANPTSDFVTPDVQAALDALNADANPPAPAPETAPAS